MLLTGINTHVTTWCSAWHMLTFYSCMSFTLDVFLAAKCSKMTQRSSFYISIFWGHDE